MKLLVSATAFVLIGAAADPVLAQTAPASSSVTRDLNSGPPAPAGYIAPAPAAAPSTATAPASTTPPAATPAPRPVTPAPSTRPTATPPASASPAAAPAASPARPATTPPASTPTATAAPAPASTAPAAAPNPPPAPPNVPTASVLTPAARAALPFTVDLPAGFEIVTGRPGPDFRIYVIRRGATSFAMVYAGPASQFPIYSGEQVQAAGRTSLVKLEDGQRHAVEHLFQRAETAGAPREIHVWTMSLDGADRTLAERIAQSVDVR